MGGTFRAVSALLAASALGCGTRANPDAAGLVCDDATGLCVGAISIISPGPMTYTNKPIEIRLAVTPADNPPPMVQILKDGGVLGSAPAPAFRYPWDITMEAEGTYQISASVTVAGRVVTAPAVTVVVDKTPPVATLRTPLPNAVNVALSEPIELTLSEPLNPATVGASAVTLSTTSGKTLEATSTLSADGTKIAVSLGDRSTLVFPATIVARLNATVADLAGNEVGSQVSWSWTAPLWIVFPRLRGVSPSLAVDADNRAVVAVADHWFGPTTPNLVVARSEPGAMWDVGFGAPAPGVTGAEIAVDPTGAPVLAWSDDHVHFSRWNGSSWDTAVGSPDTPTAKSTVTSMVLNAAGTAIVGWGETVGNAFKGVVATWSGGAWAVLGSTGTTIPGSPLLVVGGGADPYALFTDSASSTWPIRHLAGGSWTVVDTSTQLGIAKTLALESHERPVILVVTTEAGQSVMHVRYQDSAGDWRELTPPLSPGLSAPIYYAWLAFDSADHAYVLWLQGDNAQTVPKVAHFNGTAWDLSYGALNAAGAFPGNASDGQIAIDRRGEPIVLWSAYDVSTQADWVYAARSNR